MYVLCVCTPHTHTPDKHFPDKFSTYVDTHHMSLTTHAHSHATHDLTHMDNMFTFSDNMHQTFSVCGKCVQCVYVQGLCVCSVCVCENFL